MKVKPKCIVEDSLVLMGAVGTGWALNSFLPWRQLHPCPSHVAGIPTIALVGLVVGLVVVFFRPLILLVFGTGKPLPVKKGMTARLGKLAWNRNSFCRGWLITGATGTGKTAVAIVTLMHSVFRHEAGKIRKGWEGSEAQAAFQEAEQAYNAKVAPLLEEADAKMRERNEAEGRKIELENKIEAAKIRTKISGKTTDLAKLEAAHKEATETMTNAQVQWEQIQDQALRERLDFTTTYNQIRHLKYESYPWGGICMDQKGLFWQTLMGMSRHHKRDHDLYLLQTRPEWAGESWKPASRFNVLSDYQIPSNTYANAITKTSAAIAGGEGDKGFFKTQSESNIGWAIELYRQIRQGQLNDGVPESECVYPSLRNILLILTDQAAYDHLLYETNVKSKELEAQQTATKRRRSSTSAGLRGGRAGQFGEDDDAPTQKIRTLPVHPKLQECLDHFKNRYWSQPPDQLGGVQGTIYNNLNYFANDDVAEVFCADNTFDMSDLDKGTIVCVSMPQKLAVERRYVCTLLKILFFQHAQRRFDLLESDLKKKNLLVCWQDEAQRFVIDEDKDVDTLREAMATTILATQGQPSLFPPLGGKDKAKPILLNLRNRIILRAADDECAQATAEFIGKVEKKKISTSKSKGKGGTSKSTSWEEAFLIPPHELRGQKDFTAIVCHSEGPFEKYIIQPRTVKDTCTPWWPKAVKPINFPEWLRIKCGIPPRLAIKRPIHGRKTAKKVKD